MCWRSFFLWKIHMTNRRESSLWAVERGYHEWQWWASLSSDKLWSQCPGPDEFRSKISGGDRYGWGQPWFSSHIYDDLYIWLHLFPSNFQSVAMTYCSLIRFAWLKIFYNCLIENSNPKYFYLSFLLALIKCALHQHKTKEFRYINF